MISSPLEKNGLYSYETVFVCVCVCLVHVNIEYCPALCYLLTFSRLSSWPIFTAADTGDDVDDDDDDELLV